MFVQIFWVAALTIFIYMNLVFIFSLLKKNASVVDIAWGAGFLLALLVSWLTSPDFTEQITGRKVLVIILVAVWGLRLSWHIYQRNKGKPEDFRYATWRQKWGRWFVLRSYFQIFLLQGFFMFLVILPALLIIGHPSGSSWTWLDYLGVLVWASGFLFETRADAELKRFKANPANKGQIIKTGLWRYSRHPNYFGEALMWWGIFILGLNSPFGWLGLISPLTITILLTRVSGIPLLEKKYAGNPDYQAYRAVTSAFFPWPPRKRQRHSAK
ncbi:MAG: DUF1295 domain-containing protein [Candidatus Aminicenantes bacterium]|nr:DUF1295 domain-containing protein [Candidatus Aminicenantes bacterium]